MNKRHSKLTAYSVAALMILTLVPMSVGVALSPEDRMEMKERVRTDVEVSRNSIPERIASRVCEHFDDVIERVTARIERAEDRFDERHGNRESHWEAKFNDRDEKLNELRMEQDARREEWYAKLDDRAGTDEQKAAVAAFQETVEEATEDRREAVDAARDTFRDGIEALSDGREDDFTALAAAYQSAVDAAVDEAESACEDEDDVLTIRENFRAALKAAHDAMVAGRQEANDLNEEVSQLAGVRNESIRVAVEAFKDTLDDAKDTLREAFPKGEE